jgi:hypothetical protein
MHSANSTTPQGAGDESTNTEKALSTINGTLDEIFRSVGKLEGKLGLVLTGKPLQDKQAGAGPVAIANTVIESHLTDLWARLNQLQADVDGLSARVHI